MTLKVPCSSVSGLIEAAPPARPELVPSEHPSVTIDARSYKETASCCGKERPLAGTPIVPRSSISFPGTLLVLGQHVREKARHALRFVASSGVKHSRRSSQDTIQRPLASDMGKSLLTCLKDYAETSPLGPSHEDDGDEGTVGASTATERTTNVRGQNRGNALRMVDLRPNERSMETLAAAARLVDTDATTRYFHPSLTGALDELLPEGHEFSVKVSWPSSQVIHFKRGIILGYGGFSIVFEAAQETKPDVAMKILRADSHGDSGTPAEYMADAVEAAELRVLTLFDTSLSTEALFECYGLVLPKYSGRLYKVGSVDVPTVAFPSDELRLLYTVALAYPLALCDMNKMVREVTVPLDALVWAVGRMVQRVAGLHSLGVVHGDIKLQNFLVSRGGDILLSDFGNAVRSENGRGCQMLGTTRYLDPQTMEATFGYGGHAGEKSIDCTEARDAWALGVSIYLMMCNAWPIGMETDRSSELPDTVIEASRAEAPISFDRCPEAVQTEFDDVKSLVLRFLDYDAGTRLLPRQALETFFMLR
ncbi:hypothetical protein BESB_084620 [Besnoitia besnoiti]|uniref:Protein kinase domain-containing protein n=1 Tax=Besnoitia besnoiti TaxID=94643 RepID=A0A2A9MC70_BESBE|nr:hypothetical protein BESB_084620 [Besnoitia besnoiti]PFH33263.1 hypothetical protein BESB_084620 [Besnoitia besnoiti]